MTQVPGGWLAAKVGGAKLFVSGVAATAILTLMTPPLTKLNFYVLLAIRIIEGFFEVRLTPGALICGLCT